MSAPKPRPSAWDEPGCGCVSPIANGECWSCGRLALALWGHEWAAVAWMAAAVEVGDDLLGAAE